MAPRGTRTPAGRAAARITLDRLGATSHQDVHLDEGKRAMTTDLHQRLVDDLAGKGLLDNPRLRAAF
jgi:hypothetical protein